MKSTPTVTKPFSAPIWWRAALIGVLLTIAMGVLAVGAESAPDYTFGEIPDEAWLLDGSIDPSKVPDFVSALDRSGSIVGYVRATDILEIDGREIADAPIPVVSKDMNLVGHMVPDRGFVPVGRPFSDVDPFDLTFEEIVEDGSLAD